MKTLNLILICLIVAACSPNANSNDYGENAWMMTQLTKSLNRKAKIKECKVLTAPLPIAVLNPDAFKSHRDAVYKASLDYNSCKVRGIQMGMDKALATIAECQTQIEKRASELQAAAALKDYIIALATVEENNSLSAIIAAFDPETKEMVEWEILTTPIQNTAALIINAAHGSLEQYGLEREHDLDSLANTVSDSIVKFILTSHAK